MTRYNIAAKQNQYEVIVGHDSFDGTYFAQVYKSTSSERRTKSVGSIQENRRSKHDPIFDRNARTIEEFSAILYPYAKIDPNTEENLRRDISKDQIIPGHLFKTTKTLDKRSEKSDANRLICRNRHF